MFFLKAQKIITNDVTDLLSQNIIGTPNKGMLYQHLEVLKKINRIPNPFIINIFHNKKILGTCTFCKRETVNIGKTITSFYIRYFTFSDKYRTSGNNPDSVNAKNTKIRNEIKSLLKGDQLECNSLSEFFHYAYVDPRNIRSLKLCNEFGFINVRQFTTIVFHRINPKPNFDIQQVNSEDEIEIIQNLLNAFYKNYTMFSFENLFGIGTYYVIKDSEGTVLVGVQANPDRWKILELPGKMGKLILTVFSRTPFLNSIINKNYKFLTIEGVYIKEGCEKYFEKLVEGLLSKYNLNSAMFWSDTDTQLYKSLKLIDLGLVSKINHEVTANVICKFIGMDSTQIEIFKQNPAYISGIDIT